MIKLSCLCFYSTSTPMLQLRRWAFVLLFGASSVVHAKEYSICEAFYIASTTYAVSLFPKRAIFNSERFRYRPLGLKDQRAVVQMIKDPRFAVSGEGETANFSSKLRFWYAINRKPFDQLKRQTIGIVRKDDPSDTVIGTVQFYQFNEACEGCASLGYHVSPDHWNQGVATEAVAAFIRYGFEYLKIKSIRAQVRVTNAASNRVMQKLGFSHLSNGVLVISGKMTEISTYELLSTASDVPYSGANSHNAAP